MAINYSKNTWTDGVTDVDAANMNHIEDGIKGACDIVDKLNTSHKENVLFNDDLYGITSYPTKAGLYRVTSPNVSGLPNSITGYGALVIFDCGSYKMNLYIDNDSTLYCAETNDDNVPTKWKFPSYTEINAK